MVTGWSLPHIARDGEVYRLYATLQTDAYWASDVQEADNPTGDLSSGVTGEVHHADCGYHVVGMKAVDAPDISVV